MEVRRLTRSPSIPRSRSVLIVDHSDESREVLRTVLERRGVSILEARRGAEGLKILKQQHPDVVVVDLESDEGRADHLENAFHDESQRSDVSLVVLGRMSGPRSTTDDRCIISKPYHYGPLIRTIEQLLERH